MSRRLHQYPLLRSANGSQPIPMPRRAIITGAAVTPMRVVLYASVEEDANTKAFDVKHMRHFQICHAGDVTPDGLPVAFVDGHHVYEVKS